MGEPTTNVPPRKRNGPTNNVELVTEMMEFSNFGALAQAFIIDALSKHAEAVAKQDPATFDAGGMVHAASWIGVAKEIKTKMDAFYTRKY